MALTVFIGVGAILAIVFLIRVGWKVGEQTYVSLRNTIIALVLTIWVLCGGIVGATTGHGEFTYLFVIALAAFPIAAGWFACLLFQYVRSLRSGKQEKRV